MGKSGQSSSRSFTVLRGSLCILSSNHEEDLLLRYRFIAEIKTALDSYFFSEAYFQFWKQIKVAGVGGGGGGVGAEVLAVRKVGQQLPLDGYAGLRKKIWNGKVFHTLKTDILIQISILPALGQLIDWLSWGLTTRQPLWVILCRLPEKGRK